jgi:hypothetical protein
MSSRIARGSMTAPENPCAPTSAAFSSTAIVSSGSGVAPVLAAFALCFANQVGEVDRTRQSRRAAADELDIELEDFALHDASVQWLAAWTFASSQRSQSMAAMQPLPAAVMA